MIEYQLSITDMRVKKEVKYKIERKGALQKDVEDAAYKVKGGAKAVFSKLDNSYGQLRVAYQKEKRKLRLD